MWSGEQRFQNVDRIECTVSKDIGDKKKHKKNLKQRYQHRNTKFTLIQDAAEAEPFYRTTRGGGTVVYTA